MSDKYSDLISEAERFSSIQAAVGNAGLLELLSSLTDVIAELRAQLDDIRAEVGPEPEYGRRYVSQYSCIPMVYESYADHYKHCAEHLAAKLVEAKRLLRLAWGVCENEKRTQLAAEIDAFIGSSAPTGGSRSCEIKLAAIVKWLEANQPDVFSRGLWDVIIKSQYEPTSGERCQHRHPDRLPTDEYCRDCGEPFQTEGGKT